MKTIDGEAPVYPGHPVTLAWIIVQTFPSLDAAMLRSERTGYPEALANGAIPGAGGNVYSALDLLRRAVDGVMTVDRALEIANVTWSGCDGQAAGGYATSDADREHFVARWRSGQGQADKIVDDLRKRLEQWR